MDKEFSTSPITMPSSSRHLTNRRIGSQKRRGVRRGSHRLATFPGADGRPAGGLPDIWRVYAGKHWDAFRSISKISRPKLPVRMESLDSRVDDLIVYLLLFKQCWKRFPGYEAIYARRNARRKARMSINKLPPGRGGNRGQPNGRMPINISWQSGDLPRPRLSFGPDLLPLKLNGEAGEFAEHVGKACGMTG